MIALIKKLKGYVGFKVRGVPKEVILSAGKNFSCGFGAFFRPSESIIIGNDVFIGRNAHIAAPCIIKDDVMLASYVAFVGGDHSFNAPCELLNGSGRGDVEVITIEEDVWLGHGVTILSGVTVGRASIVAAGSVVTKNIPPCTIWGGNPARFIRNRFENQTKTDQHMNFLQTKYDQRIGEV